jgi:hypothetical protein
MAHYHEQDWVDFCREESGARDAGMQDHLDQGCTECRHVKDVWDSVARVASREAAYEPPESVVRLARSQYVPRIGEGLLQRVQHALLLSDSAALPQPAGVRAGLPRSRQLLYEESAWLVKLHVQATEDAARVFLIGQIVHQEDPSQDLSRLPVRVRSGSGETLDRTLTNRWGEFELEVEPLRTLSLSIALPGGRTLQVVLPSIEDADDGPMETGAPEKPRAPGPAPADPSHGKRKGPRTKK